MTNFVQLTVSGVALGCLYALVALSFVVVMKATGVFNLLQGVFVLYGAYLTFNGHTTWGAPFLVAVLFAVAICAATGVAAERFVFSRMHAGGNTHGARMFAVLLIGIGALTIGEAMVVAIWGSLTLSLGDPWGLKIIRIGGVALTERDVWVTVLSVILLAIFWWVMQRSRVGVAMRATASDSEAARAQGINPNLVSAVAWTCAATAAVIAGVMLGTEVGGGVIPTLGQIAFTALPALILGGADSLIGCVVGGIILGLLQTYAAGYAPNSFGQGFSSTLPWIVLILILLVKPTGLFGSHEIRRA